MKTNPSINHDKKKRLTSVDDQTSTSSPDKTEPEYEPEPEVEVEVEVEAEAEVEAEVEAEIKVNTTSSNNATTTTTTTTTSSSTQIVQGHVSIPRKRTTLVQLMGYPSGIGDDNYEKEDIVPSWNAVLKHLELHPEEASIHENGEYPIDDALWIDVEPVPLNVMTRLLRLCPEALTKYTFQVASENEETRWEVHRLLTGADCSSEFTIKRSKLVTLMGYPPYNTDDDYTHDDVVPDWDAVREHLSDHPREASIDENGCYPLQDALWIEYDPVPKDIIETLMKLCPKSLTDEAFETAAWNEYLDTDILRKMFEFDNKQKKKKMMRRKKGMNKMMVMKHNNHKKNHNHNNGSGSGSGSGGGDADSDTSFIKL